MKKFNFKTLLLAIGLVVASVQAHANKFYGNVYFDATGWTGTAVQFATTQSNTYNELWNFENISNTKLYYKYLDNHTGSWQEDGYWYFMANGSNWNSSYWDFPPGATNYSAKSNYGLNNQNGWYLVTKASADNGAATTSSYLGEWKDYKVVPKRTQTLKVTLNGSTSGTVPASMSLKGTYLTGTTSTEQSSVSISKGGTTWSNTYDVVVAGQVIMSYDNLTNIYQFDGWYNGSTQVGTDESYTYYGSVATTITAKFSYKKSTVTLDNQGADSGKEGTTEVIATYNSAMPSITIPQKTGFTFDGYYTGKNGAGTKYYNANGTSANTCDLTDNIILYAKWAVVLTVDKGTGISSVSESVNPASLNGQYDISATTATGYNFNQWTASPAANAQFANASSASTTVTIKNGSVTVTATATEILHSVSVASNDVNKGTVSTASVSGVGIATKSASITATPNPGYYFTGWTIPTGVTIASGSASSTTIQINATADSRAITANFANRYAFRGSLNDQGNTPAGMPGWVNDALITFTGETGSVQYTLQPNKQYKFLIYDLKNSRNRGFTSSDQTFSWNGTATFDGTFHALLNTRGTGTYTFTITMSGDNPRVTLAGQTSYQITFGKGTGGSTITAASSNDGTITSGQYVKTGSTVTFTQTPSIGYEFKGWYTSADGSTAVDGITTAGVMANVTADKQVYAQYKPITYNITYPASPEHYTINTEAPKTADYKTSATFTVTPDKGYLVDVTAVKTGSATSVTLQRSGNTYTISSMPAYDVTINVTAHKFKLNGWGTSSSDKEFDANWEYKADLNALTTYEFKLHNTAAGLSNNGYFGNNGTIESTITSGWTMSDTEGTKLKLKTGIAGTYTFTYCEVEENGVMKPQIKVTFPQVSKLVYNGTDYPFTEVSSGVYKAGPLSLAASTPFNTNIRMYWEGTCIKNDNDQTMSASSHTDWGMERYTSGGPYYIKLTTAGSNNTFAKNPDNYYFYYKPESKKLTAEYPSYWRGDDGTTLGWNYDHPMEFVNDVATIELDVQTSGDREMKVIVEGQYWTYEGAKITTSTNDIQFVKDDQANKASFKFNVASSMTGTYTFTFNRSNHQMSVNYPDVVQYDITYTDAEGTKTIKAGPNGGRGISAANKPGYRFTGWVIGPVDDHSYITVAGNDNSRQTTTVYGHKAGGSITATYSNDEFIYFKNIPGWSNVNVYFYDEDYFDPNNGSGCLSENKEEKRKAYGWAMTRIPNTDIWYLDYKGMGRKPSANIVAFSDHLQNDNQWFYECQVAYRKDFSTCTPMYMPVNWIHERLCGEKTAYYEQGCWMKFDSQESGYTLRIYSGYDDATQKAEVAMTADYAGGYSFRGSVILPVGDDQPGHVYGFKLNGCNGSYFGNNGEMNSGNCSNWEFNPSSEMRNCGLKTTSKGEYIFTMSFSGGVMHVSVEYPLSNNDYRVVYSDNQGELWNGLYYKNSTEDKLDTASFYIKNGAAGAVVKLQKCMDASKSPVEWGEVQSIDVSSYETGVYNFKIAQTSSTATLSKIGAYTGNYYIRSKALDGGLEGYEANADNRMNYTTANPAFAADNQQGYNYYKTRWITIGKDVSYTVANDYSKNISATMTGDEIIGDDKQTLPADANVRFTWNSNTNALSRAYIKGSSNAGDKFVQVYGTNVFSDQGCTISLTEHDPGLFKDNQDWVYEYTMYATSGATATVKTDYNQREQLLISNQAVFSSTKGGDVAKLRALYDFKTNRFVAAWTPSGRIDAEYSISADIMLMRNGQQQADQMTFGENGSITGEPKTVYGAVQFDKSLMALETGHGYQTYDRSIFWISFPFDVRLNDVFGLGQYGKYWIIRYYDGAERASKGWFQETKTFWKTVSVEEREHGGTDGKGFVLKAYEGYNLVLDYNAVLKDLYPNGATENYLFFPSKDKLQNIPASLQKTSIDYAPLTCTITSPEDRTNEDSNWRVIGVPSYADPGTITAAEGIKFYYAWNSGNNTLGVDKVGSNLGTFQSMHAYMVQFAGTINWSTKTVTPATAPLFAQTEKEEYSLRLELQQEGKKVDQAYVDLTDEATEEFDLNLDITKLMYSTSQIYSFIGTDKVAANSLPVQDVVVPLCVTAAADGTYTIALPDGTEGLNVTLYDVTAGKETNMSFDGYTVNLDKGEYNNRFLLNISVPRIPTNIDNVDSGEWSVDGKTQKLLINDQIYLINAGRVYNATGAELR